MRETWVQSLGWEDSSGGGHGNPLQYSCLENPHGQRSLAGYSPRGHKVWDTTEWLSTQHICHLLHDKGSLGEKLVDSCWCQNVFILSYRNDLVWPSKISLSFIILKALFHCFLASGISVEKSSLFWFSIMGIWPVSSSWEFIGSYL